MPAETIDEEPEDSGRVFHSGRTKRARARAKSRPQLITDARRSPEEDRHYRERMYTWLQGSRIPFLLLSALTYLRWENWWLSTLLFIVSVPLPWIAVVIANGRGEPRDSRTPAVYKPGLARQMQQQASDAIESPKQQSLEQGPTVIDH